ncbi:MAG: SDR family NAD(P)-dependent oxidoreductase [Gammaproteobacteria bacterium]|nr:SDR family NAD(P)-dependent oxidoreductase [Gammaproteobacteria bacterium]
MSKKDKSDKQEGDNAKAVPLAIVGIGCLFPKANDAASYWQNIRDGVDAITDIPDSHWKPEDYFNEDPNAPDMTYARRGGFIDEQDFDPLLYGLSPNNIEATDSTQLLGMVVARQALLDAGYATASDINDGRQFDRDRTSVILGVTGTLELVIPLGARLGHPIWRQALKDAGVDEATTEDIVERISEGYVPWQENSFPGLLGNVAAGRIANRFDLGGTNCVVDAACASSLSAVHMAAMELYAGRADMAITGGFDTFNDIFMYMCFSKTPALSPTGNSKPFDANGDGTILGEGLGAVILKRLDDAERDGDKIYAVIKGIGSSSDGRGNAIYAPSAQGQTKALKNAYDQAGVSPLSIELVEAHGTGTKVGDAVEAEALSGVYREAKDDATWCAIGSVKSMIGHTKAAAGVAGLIKIAMALQHKVVPPTIKVDKPLELLEAGSAPVYVNAEKRPWISATDEPRRAALSAFGFGGSNFHCVLEEAEPVKKDIEWDGRVLLFSYSADEVNELMEKIARLEQPQSWSELRATAARSRQNFDQSQSCRLSWVLTEEDDLKKIMEGIVDAIRKQPEKGSWTTPSGISFSRESTDSKLAMLFPGQGSQYTNMLLDLACQFPQMQGSLDKAQAIKSNEQGGEALSRLIFPISVFDKAAGEENENTLRQTQNAQPAIGACSIGAFNILQHFAVEAEATAGHSFGELTALCSAGIIDEKDLHRLANKRGELMRAKDGDHGAMLAVSASAAVVHEFLEAEPLDLIIANNNAPTQVVLSGSSEHIDLALARFQERGVGAKKLPVSAAFHSIYVSDAEKPFAEYLQDIEFNKGEIGAYANTTSELYPHDSSEAKALLAGQLAKPVEFVAQIENMYAAGVRTFLEVGPGKVLTTLVSAILGEREHQAIALDASRGRRSGQRDLAMLLGQLGVAGHKIDLEKWDPDFLTGFEASSSEKKSLMTIPVGGANYAKARTPKSPATKPAIINPAPTAAPLNQRPVAPTAATSTPATNSASIIPANSALQATQQSILALQKMQEQTAQLHKQYLESQEQALANIQQLVQQQHQLLTGEVISAPMPTPTPLQHTALAEPVQTPAPHVTVPETEVPLQTAAPDSHVEYESLLLEVVADKTGYPVDMLSMDMSLDTDLGIDSIKRVEILSALQEKLPGVSRVQPENLGTFQMLKHIVEFLAADAAKQTPLSSPSPATKIESQTTIADDKLQAVLLEVVADKTGYPVDMLNLDMNMDSDLGIDSIKRVEILSAFQERMPEAPMVNPEDLATLQTLQQIVDFMRSSAPLAITSTASVVEPARFQEVLLEVVADKTGYPAEMLNLDMNMDSDLGIDSIKRVEILSAFQERMPEAPLVNPEDLATLQTLQQIVDFMQSSAPTIAASASPANDNLLQEVLLEVVANKTGYPVEMLNLDMNMDSDLGIDSIKRVEILSAFQERMPEAPAVNPEDLAALQTLQQIVEHMASGAQQASPTAPQRIETTAEESNTLYRSVIELQSLNDVQRKSISLEDNALVVITDDGSDLAPKIASALQKRKLRTEVVEAGQGVPEDTAGLLILAPMQAQTDFLLAAFSTLQKASTVLRQSAERKTVIAGITRLGGTFGFENLSKADPISGGLAGMIKTADKEWAEVHCKAIDIPANRSSIKLAKSIVDELLLEGPLEVGVIDDERKALVLNTQAYRSEAVSDKVFSSNDLIVISGGARGVTAEVGVAFAETYQSNLLLLGRSPLPAEEAECFKGLKEEATLKKAIIEQSETKPSLAEVEAQYKQLLNMREIRGNIERMRAHGVDVLYESVDVRDQKAVSGLLSKVRKKLGPISGIIHGAGVLADRLIEDKTTEQFAEVMATKVKGMQNLLKACRNDKLKLLVSFSSSTARLGRKGQIDYAVANEALNKIAQQQQAQQKDCRVLSVNWGPWDGGMVTPQLKKLFESEGVGVIPLQAGATYLMQEIASPGSVEVVLLGSEIKDEAKTYLQSKQRSDKNLHLVLERKVTVKDHPVLSSHVMNGKAVLPAALIAEWLAHGAMHNHPGLSFLGFNDFRVLKGVVLDSEDELTLKIMSAPGVMDGEEDRVYMELRSDELLHASAEVVLGMSYATAPATKLNGIEGDYPFKQKEYYRNHHLFHGPDLQCLETIDACSAEGISGQASAAPHPSEWMSQPLRSSWHGDPMIIDAAFQMMIHWSMQENDRPSLPTRFQRYRQYQRQFPKDGANIHIQIEKTSEHAATANIQIRDKADKLIASIEGYECVIDASLIEAFKRNTLELSAQV